MIKYILKNLKLSKKLYIPMLIFSIIMSGLISLTLFMYNSTKANAVEYAKVMGDLDIGIFYSNINRNNFYDTVHNLDLDAAGIKKIIEVPFVMGDLAVNGILDRYNVSPLSYLYQVSPSKRNIILKKGEILVPSIMDSCKSGDIVTFIYKNDYGEISSKDYTIKGFYYVNNILENTVMLSDSDFYTIFDNNKPCYFSVFAKNDNNKLLTYNQFQKIYDNLSEQLKSFEDEYFISFFSKSIYDEISRFILLIEIAATIVIIIILVLEFSLAITIFISLLDARKTDLGMFMAFGMNKRKISIMFFLESFIVSLAGTLLGIGLSVLAAYFARYIHLKVDNYIIKIVSEQFINLPQYFDWKNILMPLIFSNIIPASIYFIYEKHQINKNISNLLNEKG